MARSLIEVKLLEDVLSDFSDARCFRGTYSSRELLELRLHYLNGLMGNDVYKEKGKLLGGLLQGRFFNEYFGRVEYQGKYKVCEDGIYGWKEGKYSVKVAEGREGR